MNDETTTLDQADEDILILTPTVSDEALKAAAGTDPIPTVTAMRHHPCC